MVLVNQNAAIFVNITKFSAHNNIFIIMPILITN